MRLRSKLAYAVGYHSYFYIAAVFFKKAAIIIVIHDKKTLH